MTKKERDRKRYYSLKSIGVCPQCGLHPACEDSVRCVGCRARDNEGKRIRKEIQPR